MKFQQVRILADENISPKVVAFLRSQGIDVVDTKERGWYVFSHSLTIASLYFCAPVPLLCKEGRGEVEAVARTTKFLAAWLALPLLTSPYKGEEQDDPSFLVPWSASHSVNELLNIHNPRLPLLSSPA